MINRNYTRVVFMILFFCFFMFNAQLKAQNTYFFVDFGLEKFNNTDAFKTIVNDFNNYHTDNKYTFNKLETPDLMKNYSLGFKFNLRHSSLIYDLHFRRTKCLVEGTDSLGNNYLHQLMKVTYSGFSINYNFNFISTHYFRTGPGMVFNLDQYFVKTKNNDDVHSAEIKTINHFMLSAALRYTFSFGGPRFNFDIIPYYQYPFWSISLQDLNTTINNGYAKSYSREEMKFSPVSMGILLNLCFGFKSND